MRLKITKADWIISKSHRFEPPDSAAYSAIQLLLLDRACTCWADMKKRVDTLKRAPRTGETLYMLGNSALKSRDPKSSVTYFAEMFGVAPTSAAAHLLTAQLMVKQELLDEAEAEAKTALTVDARIPQAHYLLGELLTFKGETDKAIEELKTEIQINPSFAMAYYKLRRRLLTAGTVGRGNPASAEIRLAEPHLQWSLHPVGKRLPAAERTVERGRRPAPCDSTRSQQLLCALPAGPDACPARKNRGGPRHASAFAEAQELTRRSHDMLRSCAEIFNACVGFPGCGRIPLPGQAVASSEPRQSVL